MGKRCGKGKENIEVIEKVTDYTVSIGFEVAALEFSPIKATGREYRVSGTSEKGRRKRQRIVESVDIRGTVDAAFDICKKGSG